MKIKVGSKMKDRVLCILYTVQQSQEPGNTESTDERIQLFQQR